MQSFGNKQRGLQSSVEFVRLVDDCCAAPKASEIEDGGEIDDSDSDDGGQSLGECHGSSSESNVSLVTGQLGPSALPRGETSAPGCWRAPAPLSAKHFATAGVVSQLSDVSRLPRLRQDRQAARAAGSNGSSISSSEASPLCEEEFTTIILHNVPGQCSRMMLLEVLNSEGFGGCFDFVYLPANFKSRLCFGYAFVNLVSPNQAVHARLHFQGFAAWGVPCERPCETGWSVPHQGFAANVERYRNSPVMHADVPDDVKPMIFFGGVRQVFPTPEKEIRHPRTVKRTPPIEPATEPQAATRFNQLFFNLMDS